MLLKEKTAVITGCNRGIGKSILEIFAKNQSNIFGCVRKIDDDFKKLVEELQKKYNVNITPVEIDLSNVESIDSGVKKIQKNGIPIDILVNNAGIIEIAEPTDGKGIDVTNGNTCEMIKHGIIDPVLVTKSALKNAVSVVTTIISADCIISNMRGNASS